MKDTNVSWAGRAYKEQAGTITERLRGLIVYLIPTVLVISIWLLGSGWRLVTVEHEIKADPQIVKAYLSGDSAKAFTPPMQNRMF